ncbi:response regulator [Clostridium sp. OS1-26]|uniref:response regulator n=1 Tax=Clostridium sp. OS1-26 TaxID=3070681 RepID=UPI0027E1DF32|nr:response regulator [Clostridium sp. OS1-26]WML33804.1 response regulator [Clostridium sp. OS1-26]
MLNGKKMLIVEDSRTIRLQIKIMLEHEGATVVEAGSEWGMFSKIEEFGTTVDLIIMDLVLHNEDGLKLIENLKMNSKYNNIPVIILTEKVELDSILEAKKLSIKYYLKKPVKKLELINRINSILNTSGIET